MRSRASRSPRRATRTLRRFAPTPWISSAPERPRPGPAETPRMSGVPAAGTTVYAVLGHPVEHSLSPPMQNAAFRGTGRDALYVALDVLPERLSDTLRILHAAGVMGLNLTAPLKEAAWPHLAGATEEAERVRAVNTLRWEAGGWMGDATDGAGFGDWMAALRIRVEGARVLLLGAGGAARSIAPWLLS